MTANNEAVDGKYTYWLGRHLVQDADRLAGDASTGAPHLGWLYGGLHVPETFLGDARAALATSHQRPG